MEKTVQAAIRARLEAAGITASISTPAVSPLARSSPTSSGFITLPVHGQVRGVRCRPDRPSSRLALQPRQSRAAALQASDISASAPKTSTRCCSADGCRQLRTTYERATGATEYRRSIRTRDRRQHRRPPLRTPRCWCVLLRPVRPAVRPHQACDNPGSPVMSIAREIHRTHQRATHRSALSPPASAP